MFRTLGSFLALAVRDRRRPGAARAVASSARRPERPPTRDVSAHKGYGTHFQTSDRCVACHNGITTPTGEDISIGINWRTSMMANAGRDPYWMAGVRRETIDHPTAASAHPGRVHHLPHADDALRSQAGRRRRAKRSRTFRPTRASSATGWRTMACRARCATRSPDQNLGKRESFVGGFKIDEKTAPGERHVYGPFEIDKGHTTIMKSSSTFQPTEGKHIRASELCATCHTLLTKALDAQGKVIGELPEQVPYQEWLHSDYKETRSCQSCHMPVVKEDVPITSVFGEPRAGFSRHTFVGGNFFMQRMLNRFRNDLSVAAPPQEMDAAANRTIAHLQSEAAKVAVQSVEVRNGRLEAGDLGREPGRPQAADRVSLTPRVAARDGARPQRKSGLRVRRAESQRLDPGQRQRRGRHPLRAALHRDHASGSGADLRERHGGRRRRR